MESKARHRLGEAVWVKWQLKTGKWHETTNRYRYGSSLHTIWLFSPVNLRYWESQPKSSTVLFFPSAPFSACLPQWLYFHTSTQTCHHQQGRKMYGARQLRVISGKRSDVIATTKKKLYHVSRQGKKNNDAVTCVCCLEYKMYMCAWNT